MLESLRIENFAIIDHLELEFVNGFNVFTGETGAGKSIIVGALEFVLGGRAGTDLIRKGQSKVSVEAVFDLSEHVDVLETLERIGVETENGIIILRREYHISGRNRVFVNGSQITVSMLKDIGELLVDVHGQHEHQSILKVSTHLDLVDKFAGLDLEEFKETYRKYIQLEEEINHLTETEDERKKKYEFNKFVISEIDRVNPYIGEDEEIEEKIKTLENYEKIRSALESAYSLLYGDDSSAVVRIDESANLIESILNYGTQFSDDVDNLLGVSETVKDVAMKIRDFLDSFDYNPEELEHFQNRLFELRELMRKYGPTLKDVLEFRDRCVRENELTDSGEQKIEELRRKLSEVRERLKSGALEISKLRQKSARELEKRVEGEFQYLGLEKAKFRVEFRYFKDDDGIFDVNGVKVEVNDRGVDKVEFMVAINEGEDLKPLRKVASGGEISRIVLALKTVLSDVYEVPIMVFDEIDVGIGGKTALKVADRIKEIAKNKQVIVITHLPQIASRADKHFFVDKKSSDGRTTVEVKVVEGKERINEIARMMSGEITDVSLRHAEELLGES